MTTPAKPFDFIPWVGINTLPSVLLGKALGYSKEGSKLAELISTSWRLRFLTKTYVKIPKSLPTNLDGFYLQSEALEHYKVTTGQTGSHANRILILTESGVNKTLKYSRTHWAKQMRLRSGAGPFLVLSAQEDSIERPAPSLPNTPPKDDPGAVGRGPPVPSSEKQGRHPQTAPGTSLALRQSSAPVPLDPYANLADNIIKFKNAGLIPLDGAQDRAASLLDLQFTNLRGKPTSTPDVPKLPSPVDPSPAPSIVPPTSTSPTTTSLSSPKRKVPNFYKVVRGDSKHPEYATWRTAAELGKKFQKSGSSLTKLLREIRVELMTQQNIAIPKDFRLPNTLIEAKAVEYPSQDTYGFLKYLDVSNHCVAILTFASSIRKNVWVNYWSPEVRIRLIHAFSQSKTEDALLKIPHTDLYTKFNQQTPLENH
jgi:hypothetical protein